MYQNNKRNHLVEQQGFFHAITTTVYSVLSKSIMVLKATSAERRSNKKNNLTQDITTQKKTRFVLLNLNNLLTVQEDHHLEKPISLC